MAHESVTYAFISCSFYLISIFCNEKCNAQGKVNENIVIIVRSSCLGAPKKQDAIEGNCNWLALTKNTEISQEQIAKSRATMIFSLIGASRREDDFS